jgi:hypothetical protein
VTFLSTVPPIDDIFGTGKFNSTIQVMKKKHLPHDLQGSSAVALMDWLSSVFIRAS